MPIQANFNVSSYHLGRLSQQCDACTWWQTGHYREVIECPLCGHRLNLRKRLTFGGVSLYYDGERVKLTAPYNPTGLVIDAADLPDAIHFLCSLIDDWRKTQDRKPWGIRSGVGRMPDQRHWLADPQATRGLPYVRTSRRSRDPPLQSFRGGVQSSARSPSLALVCLRGVAGQADPSRAATPYHAPQHFSAPHPARGAEAIGIIGSLFQADSAAWKSSTCWA